MSASKQYVLGVDIGGTKIAAALVDADGAITNTARAPMPSTGSAEAAFAAVCTCVESVLAQAPTLPDSRNGIGICAPGPLDPKTGVILNPPNVPCWRNFPLAARMQQALGILPLVDNDGNAAALAEAVWGAGKGFRNVFCATVGTGIGSGIVFDRKIYHGRTGSAAEGGHVTIDFRGPKCGCGKRGCIESFCSGPALARRAQQRLGETAERRSKLFELVGGKAADITAEVVAEAYRQGDCLAVSILEEAADYLAIWAGNIIDLIEPDVFILGGGLASLLSNFFGRFREELPKWCVNQRCSEIPVVLARFGPDAGVAGAAAQLWVGNE